MLALARRQLPRTAGGFTAESVEQELTFLGLVAMMDPPRPEVAEAIRCCREAGIRWAMITGDYGLTAESMARRIGMLSTPQPTILTGAELDPMSDLELQRLLGEREIIFARMAPEHKLRLVAAFQAMGEVVAVIGDGVNDAPALRKSDVGIVMGVIGTDVAKEAADVIITNDDFGTITTALAEGRAIYDNLRKFASYIFASNVPEIAALLAHRPDRHSACAECAADPGDRSRHRPAAGPGAGDGEARAGCDETAPAATRPADPRQTPAQPSLSVAGPDRGHLVFRSPSP